MTEDDPKWFILKWKFNPHPGSSQSDGHRHRNGNLGALQLRLPDDRLNIPGAALTIDLDNNLAPSQVQIVFCICIAGHLCGHDHLCGDVRGAAEGDGQGRARPDAAGPHRRHSHPHHHIHLQHLHQCQHHLIQHNQNNHTPTILLSLLLSLE